MFVRASTLACLLVVHAARLASAQEEVNERNPLGLGWTGCSTTNPVGERDIAFACENEQADACRVFKLLPTFVSTITDPAFAGATTTIDVLIGSSPTIGQWWSGIPFREDCRSVDAISTTGNITAAVTCANPFPAGAGTLPGQQIVPTGVNPAPNKFRISSANSVHPFQPLTTGTRYYAMQLEFKTEGTLANCDPTVDNTPVCVDGCSTPACFVLNHVSIYMEFGTGDPNPDIIHYTWDGGATPIFVTYQGGTGGNCPGATPIKSATWGAIKALYR